MYCRNVIEVIDHYNSHKLVYCIQSINIDLVSKFYNNLRQTRDGHSTTHMAKQDLDFTPTILQEFLECHLSACSFVCYPSFIVISF